MSMAGPNQSRTEVGETVASFPAYEGAQKAVSTLISAGVPAREIAIVGSGLRSVERITGRLGYATAARQGAMNGLLLGLIFSAIFVLGNSSLSAFVGVMFIGIALGMLMSIVAYALMRRRRDYASVTQVLADHYDVTVLPSSIHRARQVLGAGPVPPMPATGSDAPAVPPVAGPPAEEPPRFGERIAPPAADEDAESPAGPDDDAASGSDPDDRRPPQRE
ncbi:MAG TPA: general stress protein [Microbacterium sp.]|uniref:general stress protein n=1 Tax=Microbacterium sp. TaxID=51671 RepID=UPI002B490AB1|nr:general stress protein [Microbacterium sp.]HKT55677.1 general stress protein [Microbacterium sp.]